MGSDIIIRYNGLPFYGYKGYRMVSVLLHISRSWEYDLSTSVTCERMQDESPNGYTEGLHEKSRYVRPAVDTWAYARSRGCEYPEDYSLPFPYTLMPDHEYWPDICEDDEEDDD